MTSEMTDIRRLVEALADGTITAADFRRLEGMLRDDAAARRLYLDYFEIAAVLLSKFSDPQVSLPSLGPLFVENREAAPESPLANQLFAAHERSNADARNFDHLKPVGPTASVQNDKSLRPFLPTAEHFNRPPLLGFLGSVVHLAGSWLSSPKVLVLTVVGCLATYFLGLLVSIAISRAFLADRQAQERAGTPAGAQARIIADSGCRWQDRAPGENLGGRLSAGTSRLTEGVVELEFDGGARVNIEGPAEFVARSGHRIQLSRGRMVAYVPKQAHGFTVETPTAEVIDLGTEFGVEVDGQGSTDLHVIRGRVEVKPVAAPTSKPADSQPRKQRVGAGESFRITAGGAGPKRITLDQTRFDSVRSSPPADASEDKRPARSFAEGQPIWLGNLFDDFAFQGGPLARAMRSDTFKATPVPGTTLGIERVIYGGSALLEAAPGVRFDLTNLGWRLADRDTSYRIANDAWSNDAVELTGGARLSGKPMGLDEPKLEEAIGMHANSLLTFDLGAIRSAGDLAGRALEFVCDRAGVNDAPVGNQSDGSVHLFVLISRRDAPKTAWVDGAAAKLDKREERWFVSSRIGKPVRGGGQSVSFRVPIEPGAEFLTLIVSGAGDDVFWDHAVWIGARLEVVR